jgi:hypothetical protein
LFHVALNYKNNNLTFVFFTELTKTVERISRDVGEKMKEIIPPHSTGGRGQTQFIQDLIAGSVPHCMMLLLLFLV